MENTAQDMFLKLPKTITLVRKRWFFSKVLRIHDGQEYFFIKIACDTNIELYFTAYSLMTITFHYQQMTIKKMTLGVMHYQRFIINIVICHKDPHKRLKLFVVAFFTNLFYDGWSFRSTESFYGWNNWVTLASILDSDTFIEEQPH